MRGATIPEVPTIKDPLLRAIAEFRDLVDHAIDEQKVVVGGFLTGLDDDLRASDRPQHAAIATAHGVHADPPPAPAGPPSEPAAKGRRPAATPTFDRVDPPSPTPPRPGVANAQEVAASGRSENPRERLDALAKHLDRKLRQANGSAAEPASRASE